VRQARSCDTINAWPMASSAEWLFTGGNSVVV
jgi:hypothetical protein